MASFDNSRTDCTPTDGGGRGFWNNEPADRTKAAVLAQAASNPEIAPFTMFSLDLGDARDPQTGELLCPDLAGKNTPLWDVTLVGGQSAKALEGEIREAEEDARKMQIAKMRQNVEAGLGVDGTSLVCGVCGSPRRASGNPAVCWQCGSTQVAEADDDDDDTPTDEWAYFWGGSSPTERGHCPRSAYQPRC
ncbi:MAG: hypothetical protein ACYS7Y_25300 [Planctomycetota bacterium]|jgi:hypothetical protein